MNHSLTLTVFATLLAQQALRSQDWVSQQVSLCVTTQIGPHGSFCEPFQCLPHYTAAGPGEFVRFDIGGAMKTPFVLFTGSAVPGCQPIPGITGALAAWAPLNTLAVGMITIPVPNGPGPNAPVGPLYNCNPASATLQMKLPMSVPVGLEVRFQVLGLNDSTKPPRLEFSRAVQMMFH